MNHLRRARIIRRSKSDISLFCSSWSALGGTVCVSKCLISVVVVSIRCGSEIVVFTQATRRLQLYSISILIPAWRTQEKPPGPQKGRPRSSLDFTRRHNRPLRNLQKSATMIPSRFQLNRIGLRLGHLSRMPRHIAHPIRVRTMPVRRPEYPSHKHDCEQKERTYCIRHNRLPIHGRWKKKGRLSPNFTLLLALPQAVWLRPGYGRM